MKPIAYRIVGGNKAGQSLLNSPAIINGWMTISHDRSGLCVAIIALVFGSGCSLLGLSDKEILACDHESPAGNSLCQPLNDFERISVDKDCLVYQCREDNLGCELRSKDWDGDETLAPQCTDQVDDPEQLDCDDDDDLNSPRREETCDGTDNNCNKIIDENHIEPTKATELVKIGNPVPNLSFSAANEGKIAVTYVTVNGDMAVHVINDGTLSTDKERGVLSYSNEDPSATACVIGYDDSARSSVANDCLFDESAVSEVTEGIWLSAAISVLGCNKGQLRIFGIAPFDSLFFPPGPQPEGASETQSNVYYGIDVFSDSEQTETYRCSGAHRENARSGALGIAIAAQNPRGQNAQALVAWIGDDRRARNQCGSVLAPVEILGIEIDDVDDEILVTAANHAEPIPIGNTLGIGRPALVSRPERDGGYFIGYSDETGSIAIHFVEALSQPAEDDIPRVGTAFLIPGQGDEVAIAASVENAQRPVCSSGEPGVLLGIAWRESCRDPEMDLGPIMFSSVGFGFNSNDFCDPSEPIVLGGEGSTGPAIAYIDQGFVEKGFERDEKTTTENETGGWIVSWIDKQNDTSQLVARRIALLDSQLVSESELIELSEKTEGTLSAPALYRDSGGKSMYFAYYSNKDDYLKGGQFLSCTRSGDLSLAKTE